MGEGVGGCVGGKDGASVVVHVGLAVPSQREHSDNRQWRPWVELKLFMIEQKSEIIRSS